MMITPINPIITPRNCFVENVCLKNNMARMNVNMGVRLLRTPATALGMCICATAKRKAGNPDPQRPTTRKGLNFPQSMCLYLYKKKGRNAIKAKTILAAPTSIGSNVTSAFLIRINELPHIRLSTNSNTQAR